MSTIPPRLLKQMADALAAQGRGGDTELVHVNKDEIELLKRSGGSGAVNPNTGLREFDGGGGEALTPGSMGLDPSGPAAPAWKSAPISQDVWKQIQAGSGWNPSKSSESMDYLRQDFNPTGDPNYQYTPEQIKYVTDWTSAHSKEGMGLGQQVSSAFQKNPWLPMAIGVAGAGLGLGALGYLGELGLAGTAGVDAFGVGLGASEGLGAAEGLAAPLTGWEAATQISNPITNLFNPSEVASAMGAGSVPATGETLFTGAAQSAPLDVSSQIASAVEGAGTSAAETAGTVAEELPIPPIPPETPPPLSFTWSNLLTDPLGTLGDQLTNMSPKTALSALGLGYSALKGNQPPTGQTQLSGLATPLSAQGQTMMQQGISGQLSPGGQAALDQASQAAKAQVRSAYSRMGLSGSTMEAQAMQGVDSAIASQGYGMMLQLMSQGLDAERAASTMLNNIMASSTGQSNALTGAIGRFAGGASGATGTGSNP